MRKKRVGQKGQITIFIIVGIVVLFIFFFMIQLTSSIRKEQLQQEQEKVFSANFKKEALRIYVEDCLQDELEKGLLLLGKQGRLWSDQPGGTLQFVERVNGVTTPSGGRVAYAILNEKYPQYQYAYPCANDVNEPAFCYYTYPNTTVGFGTAVFTEKLFLEDLQSFLINRTRWCVLNFTRSNISEKAEIETNAMDLSLALQGDGIAVSVVYPITFRAGSERFSHLSEFDFFYSTHLKNFFDAAVTLPLEWDTKFVEFNYTKDTFSKEFFQYAIKTASPSYCTSSGNYFECKQNLFYDTYTGLGIVQQIQPLAFGDDLFMFTPAGQTVVDDPELFVLQFVRQNRPPALDYINRSQCPSAAYDYLVLEGHTNAKGELDDLAKVIFTASARDADEDNPLIYTIQSLPNADGKRFVDEENSDDGFSVSGPTKGRYDVEVTASDGVLEDKQRVRILVDRKINTDVVLGLPSEYNAKIDTSPNTFVVSREDPVYIKVTAPEQSLTNDLEDISFSYGNDVSLPKTFSLPKTASVPKNEFFFNLPWSAVPTQGKNLGLNFYGEFEIEDLSKEPFSSHPFKDVTDKGKLTLSFSINYCENQKQEDIMEKDIIVKECIPYVDPARPFAYPFETYEFDVDPGTGKTAAFKGESPFNPYLATHSCCEGQLDAPASWNVTPEGTLCFEDPIVDCYGKTTSGQKLVQERKVARCDGKRGNVCGSGDPNDVEYVSAKPVLTCGSNQKEDTKNVMPSCSNIPDACENQPSWGLVNFKDSIGNSLKGWCHGSYGCQSLCQYPDELVADFSLPVGFNYDQDIQQKIKEGKLNDKDAMYSCGCSVNTIGHPCDAGFDGVFEGKCVNLYNKPQGESTELADPYVCSTS